MKYNSILLSIAIMLFTSSSIFATTYYVSLSGNDSNDGLTEATAWRTISYAASFNSPVSAGDTVYIKAGDYGIDDIFVDKNYTSASERIFFIGYQDTPGDITELGFEYGDNVDASVMPLINPGNRTLGEGINMSDVYSITFKNIQIGNSLSGINIWNTDMIASKHKLENIFLKDIGDAYSTALGITRGSQNTIENCLIVNATGAGMDVWGNSNLIEDCKVFSNESEITTEGTFTSMDYYIVLKGDNSIVRNCYAERDGDLEDVGHGFEIKESGENNLFVDCTVKNMIAGCYSVRWSLVKYNEFKNCRAIGTLDDISAFMIREGASYNEFNSCVSEGCDAGVRFILAGEDADYCGEHNRFNNCIIKDAEWAIDLNNYYYSSAPVDNNIFANCIIDNADYLFNCERPNSGNKLVNCIITNVDNYLVGDDPSSFDYSYSGFYNNGFALPTGTGNIEADPLFIDATSGDYHLTESSPCVDTGTPTDAPDTDFDGISRPQGSGYDMGAFEYYESIGVQDITDRNVSIYPNPACDFIIVDTTHEISTISIYNQLGQKVLEKKYTNNSIDISNLKKGMYYVVLSFNNTSRVIEKLQVASYE